MRESTEKAAILLEALQYIRQFRDKITVVKLGGSVMDDQTAVDNILLDIIFMETVGLRPVIVHGGGAAISRQMKAAGLEPTFVRGRRYTDEATMAIIEKVLAEEVNIGLVDRIEELQGRAAPLNFIFRSANALFGEVLKLKDADGAPIDLGLVGQVTSVDHQTIKNFCVANIVPVIPSICLAEDGSRLNVNADSAACEVAQSVGAEKFVLVTDVNGVRRDKDDPDSLISTLTVSEARELIESGSIESGMIPKVESCLEALEHGVHKTHIIDGHQRHSLLLEIYTQTGIGTQIVPDK